MNIMRTFKREQRHCIIDIWANNNIAYFIEGKTKWGKIRGETYYRVIEPWRPKGLINTTWMETSDSPQNEFYMRHVAFSPILSCYGCNAVMLRAVTKWCYTCVLWFLCNLSDQQPDYAVVTLERQCQCFGNAATRLGVCVQSMVKRISRIIMRLHTDPNHNDTKYNEQQHLPILFEYDWQWTVDLDYNLGMDLVCIIKMKQTRSRIKIDGRD